MYPSIISFRKQILAWLISLQQSKFKKTLWFRLYTYVHYFRLQMVEWIDLFQIKTSKDGFSAGELTILYHLWFWSVISLLDKRQREVPFLRRCNLGTFRNLIFSWITCWIEFLLMDSKYWQINDHMINNQPFGLYVSILQWMFHFY